MKEGSFTRFVCVKTIPIRKRETDQDMLEDQAKIPTVRKIKSQRLFQSLTIYIYTQFRWEKENGPKLQNCEFLFLFDQAKITTVRK